MRRLDRQHYGRRWHNKAELVAFDSEVVLRTVNAYNILVKCVVGYRSPKRTAYITCFDANTPIEEVKSGINHFQFARVKRANALFKRQSSRHGNSGCIGKIEITFVDGDTITTPNGNALK